MSVGLVLGDFDLIHEGDDYETSVLAEGTTRGNPVPIEVAVKSWLQDGAVVVTQGYDNREVRIRVRFDGPDLTALAEAEAALFAELGKPNTLTWTPPDGAPDSVFVVVTSSLEAEDDDLAEIAPDPHRYYYIRLVCEAFVRSDAEVAAVALPTPGTTTALVDAGSATTNWTGRVNAVVTAPAVVSGAVKVASAATTAATTVELTRTASITTSATKTLQVDWAPESAAGAPSLTAYGDGVALTLLAETPLSGGATRSWFYVAASSIAVLRLVQTSQEYEKAVVRSLSVDNINRTDTTPNIGTSRQQVRSIDVVGSARTQGTIAIEHETSALGDVLAYFWPGDQDDVAYSPPLRQYRVSGGSVTTDSGHVSNAYETLASATFDIPLHRLLPGNHLLVARLKGTTTATLSWSATTRLNGVDLGPSFASTRAADFTGLDWTIMPLATIILPTRDVSTASSTAYARVVLNATGSSVDLDEAWLFNTTEGQLVQVACGTASPSSGGPSRRLFIDPATVTRPRPMIRRGHAADLSDAFHASPASWQFPQFAPPRVNVLTVTTNALDATVTLRHFPRWHTHAAS